jgi:hypothetical protein
MSYKNKKNINIISKKKIKNEEEFKFLNSIVNGIELKNLKSNNKGLFNCWSDIIDMSIKEGNHHFGLTINLPKMPIYLNKNYLEDCLEYNYFEGFDIINFSGQEWIPDLGSMYPIKNKDGNFDSLENVNCLSRDNILYSSLSKCLEQTFITYFCFSVIENKNGRFHFHILISIKNFIDYNYTLKNNLQISILKQLKKDYKELDWDVRVDPLLYFKDIKNWIIYMHKDIKRWTNKALILINNFFDKNKIKELDYMYKNEVYPNHALDIYSIVFQYPKLNNKSNDSFFFNLNINSIGGIRIKNNLINQRTLINILQYYLILNEYYIYNNNVYEKIKESKISYVLVGSIEDILYNKFQQNVVKFYLINLRGYFEGFDFSYLMDTYFIKTKNIIQSIKDISTQRIEPNFGLIEFTDGIYSIKYDRFFSNKDNNIFNSKISTIKYYNKTYNWIRKNKPINWIMGIKNALGIELNEFDNEYYVKLCLYIINTIHKDIFEKQGTLFIRGKTNTGKTTLVTNVVTDYYGSSNVGNVISAKNFKWQDLIGKELGIIDEGRYNYSLSSDLLKITGQERITVEKKYSKEHIEIQPIPLIILTNTLFEDKDKNIDEALKSRLYIIEFINAISKENLTLSKEFKKKLKNEEANIIVYCNKILFSLKNEDFRNVGNKVSNKQIIDMLEYKK